MRIFASLDLDVLIIFQQFRVIASERNMKENNVIFIVSNNKTNDFSVLLIIYYFTS